MYTSWIELAPPTVIAGSVYPSLLLLLLFSSNELRHSQKQMIWKSMKFMSCFLRDDRANKLLRHFRTLPALIWIKYPHPGGIGLRSSALSIGVNSTKKYCNLPRWPFTPTIIVCNIYNSRKGFTTGSSESFWIIVEWSLKMENKLHGRMKNLRTGSLDGFVIASSWWRSSSGPCASFVCYHKYNKKCANDLSNTLCTPRDIGINVIRLQKGNDSLFSVHNIFTARFH